MIGSRDPSAPHPCTLHRCTACCHDTTLGLLDEDIARLRDAGHDRFWIAGSDGTVRLKTVDRRCVFLGPEGCTVYPIRPDGCLVYPAVYFVEEDEVDFDEFCPWREAFAITPGLALRVLRGVWLEDRQILLRHALLRRHGAGG